MLFDQRSYFSFFNDRPTDVKKRRKKLPDLIVSGLSEKQLRCKLKDNGLSSKGDKKVFFIVCLSHHSVEFYREFLANVSLGFQNLL